MDAWMLYQAVGMSFSLSRNLVDSHSPPFVWKRRPKPPYSTGAPTSATLRLASVSANNVTKLTVKGLGNDEIE